MNEHIVFFFNRLREKLWVKPLILCIFSVGAAFLAKLADKTDLGEVVPSISTDSIEALLTVLSASMLVISTFAVASMVSAYAAAASTATPRAFPLVVGDDVSQNALSAFIGSFIFSIVAKVALKTSYYGDAGNFTLFVLTLVTFTIVILTFLRWVDRIARLGRLGTTIDSVEKAAIDAMEKRRNLPFLGGVPIRNHHDAGHGIYTDEIGYVQHINLSTLQEYAESADVRIIINALPGTFAVPGRAIVYVTSNSDDFPAIDTEAILKAFTIGDDRVYDDDPRFGLIALSEIASRALSPAVNDPGTAIHIIGTLVRIFAQWVVPIANEEGKKVLYDRIEVPELSIEDMFDDAFTGIARDGAGAVEVGVRLQKAFLSMATLKNESLRKVSIRHSKLAIARAKLVIELPEDIETIENVASSIQPV